MITLLTKTLSIIFILAPVTACAGNFLSIGVSNFKAKEDTFYGASGTYSLSGNGKVGLIIKPEYANSEHEKTIGAALGILLQGNETPFFRAYPLIGLNLYTYQSRHDSYKKLWPSFGAGIQLEIPHTSIFIDASYQKTITIGRDKDINNWTAGIGYQW